MTKSLGSTIRDDVSKCKAALETSWQASDKVIAKQLKELSEVCFGVLIEEQGGAADVRKKISALMASCVKELPPYVESACVRLRLRVSAGLLVSNRS